MAFVTPTDVTVGSVLTASRYNADVTENMTQLAPFFSAWTSWTSTIQVFQAANRTSTNTYAKYLQVGKLVIASASITITATGSAGSRIEVRGLPVESATNAPINGSGYYVDAGTAGYQVAAQLLSTTSIGFAYDTSALIGQSPSFATANGDTLNFTVMYEAA
jgi:hypothetical protein